METGRHARDPQQVTKADNRLSIRTTSALNKYEDQPGKSTVIPRTSSKTLICIFELSYSNNTFISETR